MKLTKNDLVNILIAVCAVGFIAYDQYDNYQWRVAYQAHCDAEGC